MANEKSCGKSRTTARLPENILHAGVSPGAIAVYVAMAMHADGKGICWPSQSTLAGLLGMSRSWVNERVAELVMAGLVVKHRRRTPQGGERSCRYIVIGVIQPCQTADTPCQPADTEHGTNESNLDSLSADAREAERAGPTSATGERRADDKAGGGSAKAEDRRSMPVPEDWAPSPAAVAEAVQIAPRLDLDRHAKLYRRKCLAKGYRAVDHDHAWLVWVEEDAAKDQTRLRPAYGGTHWRGAPTREEQRRESSEHRLAAWAAAANSAPLHSYNGIPGAWS